MIFLVIGAGGLLVLLVSLVFGELGHDGLLDSDFFSTATLGAFTGALGFTGAALDSATGSVPFAIGVGVAVGLAFAAFTVWLTRTLRRSRTDATVRTRELVGHEARVLTAIPAGGAGQVTLRIGGQRVTYTARSAGPVAAGTDVWVSDVLSPTAVEVTPTDALGAPTALDPSKE